MTKSDFLHRVPGIIEHHSQGFAKIEITANSKENKGVCYRHQDNTSSGGTYGRNWLEVYEKLTKYLIKEGLTNESSL